MPITTTNYTYDGTDIVRETTLGLTPRTMDYVYGADGLITSFDGSNRKSYTYDALGSTHELTDEDGDETDTYDYDAWGNIRSSTGSTYNPFRYVGQLGYQYDAADGMYLLQQRYYDQAIGRFLSGDPLGYLEGPNLYVYLGDNPVNRIDPSGCAWQPLWHWYIPWPGDPPFEKGCSPYVEHELINAQKDWVRHALAQLRQNKLPRGDPRFKPYIKVECDPCRPQVGGIPLPYPRGIPSLVPYPIWPSLSPCVRMCLLQHEHLHMIQCYLGGPIEDETEEIRREKEAHQAELTCLEEMNEWMKRK